ncbi:MAG: serine/threonine-protein kinase [Myxococcota bacterium]
MTAPQKERIGKYEVLACIGVGGLGEVYCARPDDGRPAPMVAIKRLRDKWHKRPDLAQLFASEADIGRMLVHPNIVRNYETGFDEHGRLFLVMELITGRSLGELLQRVGDQQLVAYEISLHIVCTLLAGLQCAHDLTTAAGAPLNLVHRDVTPDNILITFDGVIKLSDFGVAHLEALDGSAANRGAFGKVPYMAPEHVLDRPIDRRADVYACGVILYELLTGTHPFIDNKSDDAALLERIVRGKKRRPRDILSSIPHELEAVIEHAMAPNPNKRFSTAREMEAALRPLYRADANWSPIIAGMMRQLFAEAYAQHRGAPPH